MRGLDRVFSGSTFTISGVWGVFNEGWKVIVYFLPEESAAIMGLEKKDSLVNEAPLQARVRINFACIRFDLDE